MLATKEPGYQAKRKRMEQRLHALEQQRRSWDKTNRDICDYVLPGAARFLGDEQNRGDRDDLKLIDDAGVDANTIWAAGMMNGNTNQTDPWYTLGLEDIELETFHSVQEWIQQCVQIQMGVYARSNTYQAFHKHFQHLGPFGGSASFLVDDPRTAIHNHMMPPGQYSLACDERERIDTCYRRFAMTVGQVVERWGLDAVSPQVRMAYNRGDYDQSVQVVHVVEPRRVRDPAKRDSRSMPWFSCYFEYGIDEERLLSESGFTRFPVIAPRYDVHCGDVYGFGPGRRALGAIKQLQQQQFDKAVAIDKMVDPALQGDASLKGQEIDRNPGGFIYTNAAGTNGYIRPLHDVRIDLNHVLLDIDDVRRRIHRAFNADLWLMLARREKDPHKTAREVAAMQAEQLAMLAPTKARIDDELLRPHVEATFERLFMAGRFPPPPPELAGKELTVRFVGILAQAQKMAGISSGNQFLGFAGSLLEMGFDDVRDRIDVDGTIDTYANLYAVPTRMLVPKERAQPLREARNRALAAKEQAEQLQAVSKSARDLAAAPTDQDNALTSLAGGA